ncbi:hypothetical protein K440DRAFT_687160 [Wilcoxina mikolae CBS 423.85]|nr:hypothetical protein K440DRAFT_687160 [Wilcoxina mikolae CBS 423.85]
MTLVYILPTQLKTRKPRSISLYTTAPLMAANIIIPEAAAIPGIIFPAPTSVDTSTNTTTFPNPAETPLIAGTTTVLEPKPTTNLLLPADTTLPETTLSTIPSINDNHTLGALGIAGIGMGILAVVLFVFTVVWHKQRERRKKYVVMTGDEEGGWRLPPSYQEAVGVHAESTERMSSGATRNVARWVSWTEYSQLFFDEFLKATSMVFQKCTFSYLTWGSTIQLATTSNPSHYYLAVGLTADEDDFHTAPQ